MGRKIFVSYKYADTRVANLASSFWLPTTPRHYVNELQLKLTDDDHIYKGENDDESLENFKDETIKSKLRGKIFDSSTTIVLISKGMKDHFVLERDQWIPWEIAYSLRVLRRKDSYSTPNAILAVVLPDEMNNYNYFISHSLDCDCTILRTDFLFQILRSNMFNIKIPHTGLCQGMTIYHGYPSYIHVVKWSDFITDITKHIEIANEIRSKINDYNLVKTMP